MSDKKLRAKAIQSINKNGILLVYPVDNKPEPRSLWHELYPKKKMIWDWNEDGSNEIAVLWRMKEELSRSKEVVYTKWYRNRATFLSRDLFTALYALTHVHGYKIKKNKAFESDLIFETLEQDSPLSTKQIKQLTELQGKTFEAVYEKSMKYLWQNFDIVAYGEVDDSSFPSLAVAATKLMFEDLVHEAEEIYEAQALKLLNQFLPKTSLWRKFWEQTFVK